MGGMLVCIESEEENQFVRKLAQGRNIWLGGRYEHTESGWKWVEGDNLQYKKWEIGQPSDEEKQIYLHMLPNGYWNDLSDTPHIITGFVCEWPD